MTFRPRSFVDISIHTREHNTPRNGRNYKLDQHSIYHLARRNYHLVGRKRASGRCVIEKGEITKLLISTIGHGRRCRIP